MLLPVASVNKHLNYCVVKKDNKKIWYNIYTWKKSRLLYMEFKKFRLEINNIKQNWKWRKKKWGKTNETKRFYGPSNYVDHPIKYLRGLSRKTLDHQWLMFSVYRLTYAFMLHLFQETYLCNSNVKRFRWLTFTW